MERKIIISKGYKNGEIVDKEIIEITPDKNKCFKNSIGHKFINSIKVIGLPLYFEKDREEEINHYKEVNI